MIEYASFSDKELTNKVTSFVKNANFTLKSTRLSTKTTLPSYSLAKNDSTFIANLAKEFKHATKFISNKKAETLVELDELKQDVDKLIKRINESSSILKGKRYELEPFNCAIFLQYNFDYITPSVTVTLKDLCDIIAQFNKIDSQKDFENIKNQISGTDLTLDKVIQNTFGLSKFYPTTPAFVLRKMFFPGYIPDFAKLYSDDVYQFLSDIEYVKNRAKRFNCNDLIALADSYVNSIKELMAIVPETLKRIEGRLEKKMANEAFTLYTDSVCHYITLAANMVSILLKQAPGAMLAIYNKLDSSIFLIERIAKNKK